MLSLCTDLSYKREGISCVCSQAVPTEYRYTIDGFKKRECTCVCPKAVWYLQSGMFCIAT